MRVKIKFRDFNAEKVKYMFNKYTYPDINPPHKYLQLAPIPHEYPQRYHAVFDYYIMMIDKDGKHSKVLDSVDDLTDNLIDNSGVKELLDSGYWAPYKE